MKKRMSLVVVCALFSALIVGCGGGGGVASVVNAFLGNYQGTFNITSGVSNGLSGTFGVQVNNDGSVTGMVQDTNGRQAALTGSIGSGGAFNVNGNFTGTNLTATASGQITGNSGSGNFQLSNGSSGTFAINKT